MRVSRITKPSPVGLGAATFRGEVFQNSVDFTSSPKFYFEIFFFIFQKGCYHGFVHEMDSCLFFGHLRYGVA